MSGDEMNITLGELLDDQHINVEFADDSQETSLAARAWSQNFKPVIDGISQDTAKSVFTERHSFGHLDEEDMVRLNTYFPRYIPTPPERKEIISNGQDVRHYFVQYIQSVVMEAWADFPFLIASSHTLPPEHTDRTATAPFCFRWEGENTTVPRYIVVGQYRRPDSIVPDDWRTDKRRFDTSISAKSIGRELRAYAYMYSCPQTFCFDGKALLLVRFKAKSREDIRNCMADCWCICPMLVGDETSWRFGLYCLMKEGFLRARAEESKPIRIDEFRRSHKWFSGKPIWTHRRTGAEQEDPPKDIYKMFDPEPRTWTWCRGNGRVAAVESHF